MKQNITLGLLVSTLLLATPWAAAQNDPTPGATEPHKYNWVLERTDGPCKSYSSVVAGKEYIAAKAVCDVPARIEILGTVTTTSKALRHGWRIVKPPKC